jgi:hypothetical protein
MNYFNKLTIIEKISIIFAITYVLVLIIRMILVIFYNGFFEEYYRSLVITFFVPYFSGIIIGVLLWKMKQKK